MQLVLVAGFNTKVAKRGPTVRLFAGKFRIVTENLVDSEIGIRHSSGLTPICNGTHVLVAEEIADKEFYLEVTKTGTESFINVFAEYIRDPKSAKSA